MRCEGRHLSHTHAETMTDDPLEPHAGSMQCAPSPRRAENASSSTSGQSQSALVHRGARSTSPTCRHSPSQANSRSRTPPLPTAFVVGIAKANGRLVAMSFEGELLADLRPLRDDK